MARIISSFFPVWAFQSAVINLKMSTLIFIDKENGEVGAPKARLRLPSGSCAYTLPQARRGSWEVHKASVIGHYFEQ